MRMIEKVVKRLEYCVENKCDICQEENGSGFPWIDGRCYGFTERLYDALALLKAQGLETSDAPKPDNNVGCWYSITHNYTLEQVVNALKAQEPRLVTESDFDGADKYGYIPVWTEEKDGDMYWECIPKVAITDPDGIGVLRYWTSRPTDEQREAIPW